MDRVKADALQASGRVWRHVGCTIRDNLTWRSVQHDTPRAQGVTECTARQKKREDIGLWGVQMIL